MTAWEEYQGAWKLYQKEPTADNYRLMVGAHYRWEMEFKGGVL